MDIATFTAALFVVSAVERLINSVCVLGFYLFSRSNEQSKAQASMQIASATVGSCLQGVASLVSLALSLVVTLAQFAITAAVMLLVAGLLYSLLEYSALGMYEFTRAWNEALGPSLQVVVVWPVRLLVLITSPLVPVWNALIWIGHKLPSQIILNFLANDFGYLLQAALALAKACETSVLSLVGWLETFVCCSATQTTFCNNQCYEAGTRVFDFITPLSNVRQAAAYLANIAHGMCAVLSGPLDIITYPLMDINFAEGVHFVANAVLYTAFQLPAITFERCAAFAYESPVMCVPDFAPVFTMLIQGLRSLGLGIDNWIDVTVLVVKATLNFTLPACTQLPDLLGSFSFQQSFFGANATVMVGLTETMFARTDGVGVQFFSTARSWQTTLKVDAFPFPVTVNYGVAAVAHYSNANHDPQGDDTMALLGCECQDSGQGLKILCGVAMFGGNQVSDQNSMSITSESTRRRRSSPAVSAALRLDWLVVQLSPSWSPTLCTSVVLNWNTELFTWFRA